MKKLILAAFIICAGLCGCGEGQQATEKASDRAGKRAIQDAGNSTRNTANMPHLQP